MSYRPVNISKLHNLSSVPSIIGPHRQSQVQSRVQASRHIKQASRGIQKVFAQYQNGKVSLNGVAGELTQAPGQKLNIIFVSAECAPYSKTGGLGDVVSGLPIELAKRGHKVLTVAPRYDQYWQAWDTSVRKEINGEKVGFFHTVEKGVDRVFIDHELFLGKVQGKTESKLYGPKTGADYDDNQKRFRLFNEAAIEAARCLPFSPGEECIFIANDWHSALVSVLLKYVYQPRGEFTNAKATLCIHNIAFQGRQWQETFKELNLPQDTLQYFSFQDGIPKVFRESDQIGEDQVVAPTGQKYEKLNWLQAGILTCDKVLTVSPNYAYEICRDVEMGVELDGKLRSVGGVEGIVNGMDTTDWNPIKDKYIVQNYNANSVDTGKLKNKKALQEEFGLEVDEKIPLFGFIGRLEEQKGIDILLEAAPQLAKQNIQMVIIGTGKAKLEKKVKALDEAYPNIKGLVKFSTPAAHMLFAGTDFMVIPSRFEPCGLIQLQAMCYGSVPLVSTTGGLVDTVKDGKTGYHMMKFDPEKLLQKDVDFIIQSVERAAQEFSTPKFTKLRYNSISQDLTWSKPAEKWEGMLEQIKYGVPTGVAKKESVRTPVASGKLEAASV